MTGLSVSSVREQISKLEDQGLLTITQRRRAGGGKTSNLYKLEAGQDESDDDMGHPQNLADPPSESGSGAPSESGSVNERIRTKNNLDEPSAATGVAHAAAAPADGSLSEDENEEIEMEDGELFDAVDVDPVGAKKMQQREEVRAKNKRAQELTATYTALVPLSKFPAVMKVVKRAMGAGYAEDRIETALRHLADDQRAVTVDSLRIAIEQLPPPPRKPKPCPCCTGATTGLTYDLCAPCRNADHFGVKCTHGPEMLDL
jgi:hypothetical protein